MPRFEPFRALRFAVPGRAGETLKDLIAPPYDVLSAAQVDEIAARSPDNIVHVDVPQGGDDRYGRAAEQFRGWVADGILVRDEAPSLTIYRLRFTDATGQDRDIAGVLGGLEVVDLDAGGVLPHERTTPKASTDRLDLTRATAANLSPVWGLSLASGLTALLAEPGEPLGEVTDDGVRHVVERITDPVRIAAITAAVTADDVLIADGHHRYGIARTYRDEVRAAGRGGGEAELTLTFVNELVADQLSVEAIHRVYSGVELATLVAALDRDFERTPYTGEIGADTLADMQRDGHLVLLAGDEAWTLTPRDGAFDGVRALDGAWLEHTLRDVEHDVTYQHGLSEVCRLVGPSTRSRNAVRGSGNVGAVLIRPVGVAEIERTAREGLLMPPKSTFFTPKLKTGLVLRPLGW